MSVSLLAPNTLVQERYQLVRLVGQGGMGAVYEAFDLRLNTIVALKQTLLTDPAAQRAFAREAQLLATLRHPGLPKVSDYFHALGSQFLAMEFIPGTDLAALLHQQQHAFQIETVLATQPATPALTHRPVPTPTDGQRIIRQNSAWTHCPTYVVPDSFVLDPNPAKALEQNVYLLRTWS